MQAVNKLFADAQADAVVHNDLAQITADKHAYTLHLAGGELKELPDSMALAGALSKLAGVDE